MHVDDLTGVTSIRHTTVSYGKSEDQNDEIATKTPIDDTKNHQLPTWLYNTKHALLQQSHAESCDDCTWR